MRETTDISRHEGKQVHGQRISRQVEQVARVVRYFQVRDVLLVLRGEGRGYHELLATGDTCPHIV